jgi:mRNA-degrading endonuclease RelE of RelBE toxin-antitoxin system
MNSKKNTKIVYKLKLHKFIEKDLKKIDKSILILFEKKLKQIIESPEL